MTFAQHGFSLQPQDTQDQGMANVTGALDAVERMTKLGFDVKWLQKLIGESLLKKDSGGQASELSKPQ
jgi:hypothetical protein